MIGVIVYHKNLNTIYPSSWIEQFKDSIINQTYKDFIIYECNYGGGNERIFDESVFISKVLPTFVDAQNYLLDKAFKKCEYVFNTNVDDWFALNRIEKQLQFLEAGYDIVSSNFALIQDDKCIHTNIFHFGSIKKELDRNHNLLCHPVIAYSKKFWKDHRYIPTEIPIEDMNLWKRSIDTHQFIILSDILCYHRIHENSVCHSLNR